MPHLKYGRKYYRFSSDELWFPGFCSIMSRLIWLLVCIVIISISSYKLSTCDYGVMILIYLSFSIFVMLLTLICEICITFISIQHTMSEHLKRDEKLPVFITLRLFLVLIQFGLAIYGCFILIIHDHTIHAETMSLYSCYHNPGAEVSTKDELWIEKLDFISISLIISFQLFESVMMTCCCVFFSALAYDYDDIHPVQHHSVSMTLQNIPISESYQKEDTADANLISSRGHKYVSSSSSGPTRGMCSTTALSDGWKTLQYRAAYSNDDEEEAVVDYEEENSSHQHHSKEYSQPHRMNISVHNRERSQSL